MVKLASVRLAAVLSIAAMLGGCARAAAPILEPMKVSVPIPEPVYCAASAPGHPRLPIANLGAASAPADTVRAYAATVVILKAAVVQREELLKACSAPQTHGSHNDETAQ
ncbi:MAG TPA: hypothetical protein VNF49_00765 [Candidatus Binataceae bacterium]|nr:hypothetical protein [Candidatus Binataceae bacterium]